LVVRLAGVLDGADRAACDPGDRVVGDRVGVAFQVLMALLDVAVVVPLRRSALRDVARWSRSQD
jgi:hypothetical protein